MERTRRKRGIAKLLYFFKLILLLNNVCLSLSLPLCLSPSPRPPPPLSPSLCRSLALNFCIWMRAFVCALLSLAGVCPQVDSHTHTQTNIVRQERERKRDRRVCVCLYFCPCVSVFLSVFLYVFSKIPDIFQELFVCLGSLELLFLCVFFFCFGHL